MESKFLSPLHFIYGLQVREGLPDSYLTLTTDLVYQSEHLGNTVHILYGFKSDGASVPKALWKHCPPFGHYLGAAVVHDWFCMLGHAGTSPIDYIDAAKVFREAMKVLGVSKWKRNKMYWAVRLFGPKFKRGK